MESLFDASFFDVSPTKPAEKPSTIIGQLDIFGNVVDLGEVNAERDTPDSNGGESNSLEADGSCEVVEANAAQVEIDPLEAAELAGELPGAPVVLDTDDQAAAEALGVPRDIDPGDVLNDPTWEPNEPIDLDGPEFGDLEDLLETATVSPAPAVANVAIARPQGVVVDDQLAADGRRNRSVDALWDSVIGQTTTVETLRSAAQQPVHAYLFVGPPGAGKVRAALAFAASILCPRGGCGSCDICTRTMAQTHPDLINVEREGASISVDQAREIIRLATRSPVEGNRKVLILNDFHLVTNAGPTLLKIVEEPPPSTIFVVLAEQITNELVTIASRCVQIGFSPLRVDAVIAALVASGISEDVATTAATAAGGRLDRAHLLATDPGIAARMAFWQNIPRRLDGTGAAASVVATEAVGMVDAAAVGPLEARQTGELAALDARLELLGGRGGAGQRKELSERHKRELKRLRDDEIRFGLASLAQAYRSILLSPDSTDADQRRAIGATTRVATASEHLIRNPNINLLLTAVFVDLSPERR